MNIQNLILKCCAFVFFFMIANLSKAHTIWIETASQGRIGQQQQVSIYFGEFSMNMPTPTLNWFSDLPDCQLMLLTPNGEKSTLAKKQEDEFYTASFTPETEGWYLLYIEHIVKDLYQGMRITYQAIAWVKIGTPNELPSIESPFSNGKLILPPATPSKLNETTDVTLIKKGTPAVSQRFTLTSNKGWKMNLRSNKETGKASSELLFPAKYLYEWSENITIKNEEDKIQPEHKADYINTCYFFKL